MAEETNPPHAGETATTLLDVELRSNVSRGIFVGAIGTWGFLRHHSVSCPTSMMVLPRII